MHYSIIQVWFSFVISLSVNFKTFYDKALNWRLTDHAWPCAQHKSWRPIVHNFVSGACLPSSAKRTCKNNLFWFKFVFSHRSPTTIATCLVWKTLRMLSRRVISSSTPLRLQAWWRWNRPLLTGHHPSRVCPSHHHRFVLRFILCEITGILWPNYVKKNILDQFNCVYSFVWYHWPSSVCVTFLGFIILLARNSVSYISWPRRHSIG